MPRKTGKVPAYCRHKASGRAVVRIDGHDHYLGPYGSPESYQSYERLIALWRVRQLQPPSTDPHQEALSINELLLAYWQFANGYYGQKSKELGCMRDALRPVKQLYGHTLAADFGPKALKAVRQQMIDQGLSRRVINYRVRRIKRCFKWAVEEELVPPSVHHGLQAVRGLERGRTAAREPDPIKPAPEDAVEAVLPFVSPPIAAMIQLQRLTGMRPREVTIMRACDIDMTGDVWIYEPHQHKNNWREHRRLVALGPKAQEIIRPFLDRDESAYLFSPREADQWRRERRPVHLKRDRKTPIYPSELRARERAKAARKCRQRKRPPRECYDTDSYRRAITYGFAKAKKAGVEIPHWHPNQLRHSRATEIRKQHGIEAAQVVLGHAKADVTQVYAERNMKLALRIARDSG